MVLMDLHRLKATVFSHKSMRWFCFVLIMILISIVSYARDTPFVLSAENQKRANSLYEIVRCPVCAGQSLIGSESSIAKDLRNIINMKIQHNLSDADIKRDLVGMYGQDILFEPPVNKATFLLNYGVWILMLSILLVFLYSHMARQDQNANFQHND